MEIGLIGIGKMGYNLTLNLLSKGYTTVIYDIDKEKLKGLDKKGAIFAESIQDLVSKLNKTRKIFLLLPAGEPTNNVINELVKYLDENDIIIDGGNSHYKDSIAKYEMLKRLNINFLDCGISGGVSGALNGICAMVGGDKDVFETCEKIFKDISVEDGYLYTGRAGSGHFCKMVHNAIEYGMMQSIAEGFEMLYKSEFDFKLDKVAKVWNHGSVIRSWLIELLYDALSKDNKLTNIKGIMKSTGEAQWAVETALEKGIPVPIIALSLFMRYRSLENDTFSGKIVAVLRNQFGGHELYYL
ncbi:phosphogluconate dehydrogenase (NAD(+)-dependent, decarboxylating) [Thermosediminibacter oceani]|uniref:6-phosphogluconate dehydrogenase (Decarboxylating) n=1 Tax=Thermosediminibacter oceani (strain ATCC BAA-1034 / DSM 16646 / JW/IW-1228P) TaxID=555079 RepID=D9RZ71_THEOJ|nr:decarboxylating 6-phosphogluconate dehydrogenase [Thermosediminibacter oceani]ADL08625.1 6-phosphogluconate dehydrogenase (decarboxylating) [Thermosediminibacter oceani DSM 16646]